VYPESKTSEIIVEYGHVCIFKVVAHTMVFHRLTEGHIQIDLNIALRLNSVKVSLSSSSTFQLVQNINFNFNSTSVSILWNISKRVEIAMKGTTKPEYTRPSTLRGDGELCAQLGREFDQLVLKD
jgi:hypothetical protein